MHSIEPYYKWREFYRSDKDPASPFYGEEYSEFHFTNHIYNFAIHPQWDNFGSETLLLKILYVDYDRGYTIIELIGEWNDAINNDIKKLLDSGKIKFKYGNKLMFALKQSEAIRKAGTNNHLNQILNHLLDGQAMLFQSINFLQGSEQASHSDSIHMTTYPLGGLLGVWIALEDIAEDNGPVHYYPGSHKLPYYLNADYNNAGNMLLIGDKSYAVYEDIVLNKVSGSMDEKIDEIGSE